MMIISIRHSKTTGIHQNEKPIIIIGTEERNIPSTGIIQNINVIIASVII